MVNGENRSKIKETLGIGRGEHRAQIKEGFENFIDAIAQIPENLETCFDTVLIQPTLRLVDFSEHSTHRRPHTDETHSERVRKAQKKHLKVVFAKPPDSTAGSFQSKNYPKSREDSALIEAALKENLVFSGLTSAQRAGLVGEFEDIRAKRGTKIIEEGDVGDYFYVLAEGVITFQIGGNDVGTAEKGCSFGELALLYQGPRAATCIAKTHCGLFRLDHEIFKRFLARQMKDSHAEVVEILKKVPYFKDLDDDYLNKISSNLRTIIYNDGEVMVSREKGTPPSFYIIKEGIVDVTHIKAGGSDYKDVSLKAGKFFGENAIMRNEWALGTAKARGKVVVLSLDRAQFIRVLGNDFGSLIRKTADKKKLGLIPFGKRKGPAEHELDLLIGAIKEKKFQKGHVFFKEGMRTDPALYLVRNGKVSIRTSNHPNLESVLGFSLGTKEFETIEQGGYFGNDTLGANEKGQYGVSLYTVIALEDVEVGVLDLDAIRSLVVPKDEKMKRIGMEDLEMIRILGSGTFGKVWLVSDKRAMMDAYALKIQVKKHLIDYNQVEGVIREKNIMAKLDHPFIIKMVNSWKDESKLYMLLKLYQGGELQSVIHTDSRDGVPEWAATFYAANILEGLSFMHRRNIIYRDLKPENVLLDSEGYTVIVDLGFAKIIKDKTHTFCGTPLYLAPEIIMQKGHNKGADHWSWGVLLYEMIVGMTPFYDGIVDQVGLFKNIVKCKMQFFDFMSDNSQDLIRKMLTVNPNDRLGSFSNAEKDIKRHPFFNDLDWKKLCKKELKVPFKPKVSDPLDGSNFDDFSKLEARAKRERLKKLTAGEQKLFAKF